MTGRTNWRYLAQRALTGVWLDRTGLPIINDTLTWDLTTNSLTATINPQYYGLREPGTDRPLLDEWSTLLYAEANGEIQWGGILTVSSFTGSQWQLQATGFRGYPAGQIYNGADYSHTSLDPTDAVRYLWTYLQSQPNAKLNLAVSSATTPVRIGTAPNPTAVSIKDQSATHGILKYTYSLPYTGIMTVDAGLGSGGLTVITFLSINGNSNYSTPGGKGTFNLNPGDKIELHYTGSGSPSVTFQQNLPTPYELHWYNGTDIGSELNNLSTVTPMDFTETHSWNADKSDITHKLNIGYPRVGIRRTGLRFVEGENITVLPQLNRDGTQYWNAVVAYGAGNGSTQIHWSSGLQDQSRLYRSFAYTNASCLSTETLTTLAQRQLQARLNLPVVQSIQVADHPHAPFGSFQVGDDILVQLTSGWMAGQSIWHRITAYNYSTQTNALILTLARSDSFSYAQGDIAQV